MGFSTLSNTEKRLYDKGDRRFKHVHTAPAPKFEIVSGNPKRVIGKCPSGMASTLLDALINEAIPHGDLQPDATFHKRLYVVHLGAIYEAQSSDQGKSYHGYPYKGKLSSAMIDKLREMASGKNCLDGYDDWGDLYIERHGSESGYAKTGFPS
jgi:hypothetical protein